MARRPKRTLSEELQGHLKFTYALLEMCEAMSLFYPDLPNFRYAADEIGRAHDSIRARLDDAETPKPTPQQTPQEG